MRILKNPTDDENVTPKKAVICSNNELLKVIDLETGRVQQSLVNPHSDIILCVDSSRDFFISGSKDNSIRLWRYSNNILKCLGVFTGHNENVASVCFAPKKTNFFVSASQDNTIKVWDVTMFHDLTDLENPIEVNSAQMTVMGHQKYINVVKVSPNDKLIASSSQDKTIKIWSSSDLMLQ